MSAHGPDDSDTDCVKRYRQASDAEAPLPAPATREAILAEGRRVAAERAAHPTTHRFDPKQPAANQSRWKMAAAGTAGAALLAAVLMFPRLGAPPGASLRELAPASADSSPSLRQPAPPAPSRDALENEVLSGARRAPPAPRPARKTQSAPPQDASIVERRATAAPRESQELARGLSADSHTTRTTPSAPSAASAAPSAAPAASAMAGRAVRSNLIDESVPLSIQSGDLARLGALLDEGANPQQTDLQGRTPLLLAVIAHREDMIELLLAHHADPNTADSSGETPLQRARRDELPTIIKQLQRAGAR